MGLAGLVQQEVEPWRSSPLVHSPKPPASRSLTDVCWPPKWTSTGTYPPTDVVSSSGNLAMRPSAFLTILIDVCVFEV